MAACGVVCLGWRPFIQDSRVFRVQCHSLQGARSGSLSRFPIFGPLYAVISKLLLHATAQPGFIRAVRASHALQEPTAAMAKEVWRDA